MAHMRQSRPDSGLRQSRPDSGLRQSRLESGSNTFRSATNALRHLLVSLSLTSHAQGGRRGPQFETPNPKPCRGGWGGGVSLAIDGSIADKSCLSLSRSLCRSFSLSIALSLSHTNTPSLSVARCLSLSLSLSNTHTLTSGVRGGTGVRGGGVEPDPRNPRRQTRNLNPKPSRGVRGGGGSLAIDRRTHSPIGKPRS
jgi:hypothetical protein